MIEPVGRSAISAIEAVGRFGHFVADLSRALPDVGTWGQRSVVQMRRVGVDSLPVALFIAAFTGVVLAIQASYTFKGAVPMRSEEHTSELQSLAYLVCRLLLEKKKKKKRHNPSKRCVSP